MARTDSFRKQHEDMLKIVGEIQSLLSPEKVKSEAAKIRSLLSSLAGTLRVHLAAEDKALYPVLLKCNDDKTKTTAQKFMTEMGGINSALEKYLETFPSPKSIAESAEFISKTKDLFLALGRRIDRENNELYNLADKVA